MTGTTTSRGDIISLDSWATAQDPSQNRVLVDSRDIKIIQLLIATGSDIPMYEAEGEVTIHCLSGSVTLNTLGTPHELVADQLLYLAQDEGFTIRARSRASVIVTIVAPKQGENVVLIGRSEPK